MKHHAAPTPRGLSRHRTLLARAGAGLTLSAGLVAAMAVPAQAHTVPPPPAAAASANATAVMGTAASLVGTPYVWGGTTQAGFDCSGFTGYVMARHGISLPRTAQQQMNATRQVSAAEAAPGDLVFFVSGGRAYHNGLYAGDGYMYDSGKPGATVVKRKMWSDQVVYTRVLG